MLTTFTKSTHRLVSRRGLNPNAIQPFCRTKENSHATWINSSFLEEIQRPSTLNDSIVHAQNRSLVRGEADADQDPSRVLRAALPTPGQPNLRELSFTPCRLPDGGKSNLLSAVWQSVAVGPTGTALSIRASLPDMRD
jgi:hypothetical protein